MEYDVNEIEEIELPEELSYQFAFREIQNKLMRKWNSLKCHLNVDDEDVKLEIDEFDKLLNYFI